MPDMSEEESAVIEEYVVSSIVAHSDATRRLATEQEIAYYDEREAIRNKALGRTPESTVSKEPENAEADMSLTDTAAGDDSAPVSADGAAASGISEGDEESSAPAFTNVADFLGCDGFSIDYKRHSVSSSYPSQDDVSDPSQYFFVMDAADGSELLVLHFDAVNISGEAKELNTIDVGARYRIGINEGDVKGALTTMLLDDLSSFKGTVEPGEIVPLVLVRDIPEDISINSISLTMRRGEESVTTNLE